MIMDIISLISILIMLLIFPLSIVIYYRGKIAGLNDEVSRALDDVAKMQYPEPTMRIDERLQYNKELIGFIDDLVTTELVNNKRFDIFLKTDKKNIDFDKVLTDVSTNVFDALKPDVFVNPDNILTSDYLMKYIQKRTFLMYFHYIENRVAPSL